MKYLSAFSSTIPNPSGFGSEEIDLNKLAEKGFDDSLEILNEIFFWMIEMNDKWEGSLVFES